MTDLHHRLVDLDDQRRAEIRRRLTVEREVASLRKQLADALAPTACYHCGMRQPPYQPRTDDGAST